MNKRTNAGLLATVLLLVLLLAPMTGADAPDDTMEQGDGMEGDDSMDGDGMDKMDKETEEDPSIGVVTGLLALMGVLFVVRRLQAR